MCGALDCPSCGRAQGYLVVKRWNGRRYEWTNPDEGEEEEDLEEVELDDDSESGD
jgi:hypothetical protein